MSLSVTNSLTLRLYYGRYSPLVKGTSRNNATTGTLSLADAGALRSAVKKLQDYNFEEASDSQIQERIQAFADTMNSTLSSAGKYASNNTMIKNAVKKIKQLNADNAMELKKIGITVKKDGTMSVYESAGSTYNNTRFQKFFDKDSDYLNNIYENAKRITRKVDVRI